MRSTAGELLRYPDCSALGGIAGAKREAMDLADSLVGVMWDTGAEFGLRLNCTDFLGFLGSEATLRGGVTRLLKSFAGADLDLQSTRALERIANGPP